VLPKLNLAGVGKVLAGAQGLRGGGHRPGSPGRRAGCADHFAVRPDQPGLTGAYGKVQIHLASDFPAPVPAKEMHLPTDGRGCPSVRPQTRVAAVLHALNPERVASRLSTLLLAEELR
jgi:heptosyltransferase-1